MPTAELAVRPRVATTGMHKNTRRSTGDGHAGCTMAAVSESARLQKRPSPNASAARVGLSPAGRRSRLRVPHISHNVNRDTMIE